MAYIKIKNLTFKYPDQTAPVFSDVSFDVDDGQIVVLCGKTGCGKSTLLKNLKKEIAPNGEVEGSIHINSEKIGFVFQNPENQIVTDKVWHELAFSLENEGVASEVIRLRVAEISEYFGINDWYFKDTKDLSGGQKQILNLASVLITDPDIIIFDEPTAMLDPIAKENLLSLIKKINQDFNTTIIMSEHNLEKVKDIADKIYCMEDGKVSADSSLWTKENEAKKITSHIVKPEETVLKCKDIWFRYKKDSLDVLRGFNLEVRKGEIFAMLGGNGTGKSTALLSIAEVLKHYRGKIKVNGKIGLMPQDVKTMFMYESVEEELNSGTTEQRSSETTEQRNSGTTEQRNSGTTKQRSSGTTEQRNSGTMDFSKLMKMHPYDLSGGEQQKLGLQKVLANNPEILLLDEPTKGLDKFFKEELKEIFEKLTAEGKTIVIATHDLDFCKDVADRCGLFAQGEIIGINNSEEFFKNAKFYK